MGSWSLDDIPWDAFDASRVDPDIVPIIKAASLVEFNAEDYRRYLNNVFHDDPRVQRAVDNWAREEQQHGLALARWAALADPSFDFAAALARFTAGFRLPVEAQSSVRGSRAGEWIARCMVETGTSSYYTALGEAAAEPVLKEVCRCIAADEFAHYALFRAQLRRTLARERLGFWRRLRVVLSRIAESEDDELAYAYYAANGGGEPYDRRRNSAAYARRTLRYVTPAHIERGLAMVFGTLGLRAHRIPARILTRLAWWGLRARVRLLALRAAPATG